MKIAVAPLYEFAAGVILIDIGLWVWWVSTQLVWIQIYPPPSGKTLIESVPFVFWAIGAILVLNSLSRWVRNKRARLHPKRREHDIK